MLKDMDLLEKFPKNNVEDMLCYILSVNVEPGTMETEDLHRLIMWNDCGAETESLIDELCRRAGISTVGNPEERLADAEEALDVHSEYDFNRDNLMKLAGDALPITKYSEFEEAVKRFA